MQERESTYENVCCGGSSAEVLEVESTCHVVRPLQAIPSVVRMASCELEWCLKKCPKVDSPI